MGNPASDTQMRKMLRSVLMQDYEMPVYGMLDTKSSAISRPPVPQMCRAELPVEDAVPAQSRRAQGRIAR